jgi:hypothetical protein
MNPKRYKAIVVRFEVLYSSITLDRKPKLQCWVLSEENLNENGTGFEHPPPLKFLKQETEVPQANFRITNS